MASKTLVAAHRQLIVEKACRHYGTNPFALKTSVKNHRFDELAGIVAYLLRRDTKASDEDIGPLIGEAPWSVPILLEKTEMSLRAEAESSLGLMNETLLAITDAVLEAIEEKDMIWHCGLGENDKFRFAEQIIDAGLKEMAYLGITRQAFTGSGRFHELVQIRDVIIFLLMTKTNLRQDDVTELTNRDKANIRFAMERMKNPTSSRRKLLAAVCKRLGIPEPEL